eukprot:g2328.t1
MFCRVISILFLIVLCVRELEARRSLEHTETSSAVFDWGCGDYDPAKNSSLFAYLWCSSTDIAEDCYQSGFIQGIKSGLLHPSSYSAYDIQDVWWLVNGSATYTSICQRQSCDETQEKLFDAVSRAYKEEADYKSQLYHISFSGIIPNKEAKEYVNYEEEISRRYEAKYSVPLLTPCLYLWTALSRRLATEGALRETNVYSFWIEENLELYSGATVAIGLLDDPVYNYDKQTSLEIFRASMQLEADFFASATAELVQY